MQIGEKGIENLFIMNMVLEKKKKKKNIKINIYFLKYASQNQIKIIYFYY